MLCLVYLHFHPDPSHKTGTEFSTCGIAWGFKGSGFGSISISGLGLLNMYLGVKWHTPHLMKVSSDEKNFCKEIKREEMHQTIVLNEFVD